MAKIVLTEEQLEKMVKRMVSSQIMSEAPVPIGNPGGMTDDEIKYLCDFVSAATFFVFRLAF